MLLNHRPKVAFNVGGDAILTCQMQAYPRPTFEWSFEDLIIVADGSKYETNVTALNNDVYQSVLKVTDLKQSDYGDYVCKAANSEGEKASTMRLQAKSIPEKPTNLRLAEAAYDSVTLQWDEGFDGGFESAVIYTIAYRSNVDNKENEADCQRNNPCTIQHLEQVHSYAFQVRATNTMGSSTLSNTLTASTIMDFSRIPEAKIPTFEPKSKTIVFHVDTPHSLIAFVEAKEPQGDWKLTQKISVRSPISREVLDLVKDGTQEVRIKLCLEANTTLCSEPVEAVTGNLLFPLSQAVQHKMIIYH